MRFPSKAVGILALAACSPNSLSGPLAFPVSGEFATIGTWGGAPPFSPPTTGDAGIGVYLLGAPEGSSCSFYFVGEGANGNPFLQFDRVLIGIPLGSSQLGVGTFAIVSPSNQGPGSATVSYFTADGGGLGATGVGGSVTLTDVGVTVSGSFETTIGGTDLYGSFSAPVCNP